MKDLNPSSINKIGILCFPGLGDTILFTPCLKPIRSFFRNAKINVITMFQSSAEVLERNRDVDQVIYKNLLGASRRQTMGFFLGLREEGYDLTILPFPAYRREYNIANYLIGAKYRAAHRFPSGYVSQLTFLNNIVVDVERHLHNVENNLNLLSALGINVGDPHDYALTVVTDDYDRLSAASILESLQISSNDFVVGIHPGSFGRAKEKRWSEKNFASLCDWLAERYSARILVFIGPEEIEIADKLSSLSRVKLHLIVNKPIRVVYNLLKTCRLLVSDDSGLMHLASAAGVPVVAIFGPTDNRLLYPWGVEHRIVREGIECSPCYYYTQVRKKNKPLIECTNPDRFTCIKSITLQKVTNAIEDLLS